MQVRINKRNTVLTPELRRHIETRVALAFGRFADRIRGVQVKFTRGKAGPVKPEICCRIEVTLDRAVSVAATEADEIASVDRALRQAVRRISKLLDQEAAPGRPGS